MFFFKTAMKTISNDYIASVLIRSGSNVLSIEPAIQSVISNHMFIKELIIESKVFDSNKALYKNWTQDLAKLKELKLEPIWQVKFDVNAVTTDAVIELNPCSKILESAFVTIYNRMARNDSYQHYAISSSLDIESENKSFFDPTQWISAFGYGLFLFFLVMDTWRYVLNLGKYHRWGDFKVHTIIRTYPRKKYLVPYKKCRYLLFTGIDGTHSMSDDVTQNIKNTNGFWFTHQAIHNDTNLELGRWFFFLYPFLLFFYTQCIWTSPIWLFGWGGNSYFTLFTARWIVFSIYAFQVIPVLIIVWISIVRFPLKMSGVLCLLFPVFTVLSVPTLVWGRLFSIRPSREITYLKQD